MPFFVPELVPESGAEVAGKLRYWKEKEGRFYARISVPARLRPFLDGRPSELIEALGGDRRAAIRLHPAAVARLQHQIASAERKANSDKPATTGALFPLSAAQLAASHYAQRLALDNQLRNDPRYPSVGVDDLYVQCLRHGMAGKLSDDELQGLIGAQIERFRWSGNLIALPSSTEWREIARALCVAEFEALSRVVERDEADYSGRPTHPLLVNSALPEDQPEPVDLAKL